MTRARFQSVQPVLPSQDVATSIAFYVDKLGFALAFQDSPENPNYAGVRRDGVELHFQWHDASEWKAVERPMLRIVVPEIEALFEEYRDKGVFHKATELRATGWGTREFAFFDPYMNGLTFYADASEPSSSGH